ncbi:hypothetical protein [Pelagicoccus sp. SDUM812003]|uniref:hypothetical protein n=1 Tax=Pelagicoccus sp. SDUM812003 TaxID=3041267 RepID=UPI002810424A|nr:hypothetical protein [Pelagicoccus sp. SDUM812003]MDQ8201737.1 hypothetical protein [Pelagicoccus sp. SDUM812003]
MKTKKLTPLTMSIALSANLSLMAIFHALGFCIDFAVACTVIWVAAMAGSYLLEKFRERRADHA